LEGVEGLPERNPQRSFRRAEIQRGAIEGGKTRTGYEDRLTQADPPVPAFFQGFRTDSGAERTVFRCGEGLGQEPQGYHMGERSGPGKTCREEKTALGFQAAFHVPVGDENRHIKFSHIGFHYFFLMIY
jgi:hypothetical protein